MRLQGLRAGWNWFVDLGSSLFAYVTNIPVRGDVQVNNQQESMRKALEEEQDARFQNQGEVSILRKRMEKLTEEHNADTKRLKAARESAEAAQAQIQKDTREEIERIKTQFTFKQHEIEASLRKPTHSGRNRNKPGSSNAMKDRFSGRGAGSSEFPSTPWGATPIPNQNKTPSKSRIGDFLSPGRMLGPNIPKRSQQRPISQMVLPGFKNAFETSPDEESHEPRAWTLPTLVEHERSR